MFSSLTIIRKKKAYRKNENKRKNCQMKLLCEKEDFFCARFGKNRNNATTLSLHWYFQTNLWIMTRINNTVLCVELG